MYLVLEVYRGVEVRDLGVDGLAHHLALTGMHESTHFKHLIRRAKRGATETTTA